MTQSRRSVILLTVLLASAALVSGAYVGHQIGYEDLRRRLEPELQRRITINANLTRQNEALSRALENASHLGTVKIGYVASTPTDMGLSGAFIEEIVQPDLNAYASRLGYNVTFQFEFVEVLYTQASDHIEKVHDLKKMGVDLVISGGWSAMLSASRTYVDDNNMLLVGVTSTSPSGLPIPGDRLFRMIPPDSTLPVALASIMRSYGVKSVVILQRGDSWGDGIVSLFEPAWTAKGGTLAGEAVRYPADTTDFSAYLQAANRQAQAARESYPEGDRVALLLLAFDEDGVIVSELENHQPLYDCVMFSGYSHIGLKMDAFIGSPQASHVKAFTPVAQPYRSSTYEGLKARYPSLRDHDAYIYDGAWAIAASVLETRSVNASVVAGVLPEVCGRLYGASGWCRLDENGDRASLPMDVWFYAGGSRLNAGLYEPDGDTMTWDTGELGYDPSGP